ncbi:MAG: helix-turn-helix transcriptional regulator [Prolixibacteraceae bacterium]|nr:helix-turn-helix transcriptional regulator [Prolixibacteraceae bacterium]
MNKILLLISSYLDTLPVFRLSDYLQEALQYDYTYLSVCFSRQMGITIEKYLIREKIRRAILLWQRKNYTLSEIAIQLNYKSVAHLSAQFKKVVGKTFSAFKEESRLIGGSEIFPDEFYKRPMNEKVC